MDLCAVVIKPSLAHISHTMHSNTRILCAQYSRAQFSFAVSLPFSFYRSNKPHTFDSELRINKYHDAKQHSSAHINFNDINETWQGVSLSLR